MAEAAVMNKKPGIRPGFLFMGLLLAVAASSGAARAADRARPGSEGVRLNAFFEREYRWQLQESPESATFDGVNDFNDRLTDRSSAAIARRKAHVGDVIRTLIGFDRKQLGIQDRISRDLMLDAARQTEAVNAIYGELPFDGLGEWIVVAPNGGPQQGFAMLAKATPFATARDYENYLKRLHALPRSLEQSTALMREGMRSGWMPPREIMDRVPAQFDDFIAPGVESNPLFRPFNDFAAGISQDDRDRLAAEGRRVLVEQVAPAFKTMRDFLVREYLPACRTDLAASTLPGGLAYYALAVHHSTTTTLTPRQIHDIGLREVDRIGTQMDALIAELGFKGTRTAFFDSLRADPRFYYTSSDEMLKDYRDIAKRVDAALPSLFAELPRLPYGVRAMEAYEGDNAEHYTAGALDGSRAGYFEANVRSLATRPKYDMENTFVHEAVPGHHLQIARAQELKGLPTFRRNAGYTAYTEGWALYAESLGPEVGVYQEPYSRFGAMGWDMVRACRLVIDTGIHAFGWTRDRSIAYMMDNAGLQRGFATAEIDRYIASPGQALGYKIGQLKIRELRDRARATLGDRFDIRFFHNAILDDGALPLTVLESRIDEWIATRRKGARSPVNSSH